MQHPASVGNLRDGDTVIVRPHRRVPKAPQHMLTTHQADYVRHPPQTPVQPTMSDDTSTLSDQVQGKRMDGTTVYNDDYVPKAACADPAHGDMGNVANYQS